MKKIILMGLVLGIAMGTAVAAKTPKEKVPAEIKLRDVDLKGMMNIDSDLSLTVTFDVRKADLFDELQIDFYILLEPDDEEQGLQFFHTRTTHRYLEKKSGYRSGVTLPRSVLKCIRPDDAEFAVVVTMAGEVVAVEQSTKERWWEDKELGSPIENVFSRSSSAMIIRDWETR